MRSTTQRRLGFLVGFVLYFAALWLLWETPVVYPLRIFVVLLHELSHAVAVAATGGTVERIVLTAEEGGATYARGGNAFVTLSAGYLGSLFWGLALVAAARARAARGRLVAGGLGMLVLAAALFFVRGAFGVVFCVLFGAGLVVAARRLRPGGVAVVLTTLGLTSALYAVLDIRGDVLRRPNAGSDARMLAELTGVPTVAWGALWLAVALVACWAALRREWRRA